MFVFYDLPEYLAPTEPSNRGEVDEYVQKQLDVYDTIMEKLNPARKVHTFGNRNTLQNPEQIDFFNIVEFPTIIILDNSGVVLRTTDMDEVDEFLQTLPDY